MNTTFLKAYKDKHFSKELQKKGHLHLELLPYVNKPMPVHKKWEIFNKYAFNILEHFEEESDIPFCTYVERIADTSPHNISETIIDYVLIWIQNDYEKFLKEKLSLAERMAIEDGLTPIDDKQVTGNGALKSISTYKNGDGELPLVTLNFIETKCPFSKNKENSYMYYGHLARKKINKYYKFIQKEDK